MNAIKPDDLNPVVRQALADPAFRACLSQAADNTQLVREFDRLRGASLSNAGKPGIVSAIDEATGKRADDLRSFVEFVYETIYCRLEASVLQSLRDTVRTD